MLKSSDQQSNIIRILHAPDIHFGHPKVEPHLVYEHLEKYLFPVLEYQDIKILAITGDFFHSLLNLNSDAGMYAVMAINRMIELAYKNHFYIRVIRGTFSHDRFQNRFFTIDDISKTMLNDRPLVRVIDNIEIEMFPSLDVTVMYCPDDQPYDDLTETLIGVIESHHLDGVDVIFSHGYYDHMVPKSVNHIPTNTIYYDKIKKYVRHFCLNGHVHTPSVHDKCISGGSFERMCHNEEHAKGFYVVNFDTVSGRQGYDFNENKGALKFITINPADTTKFKVLTDVFKYIDELIDNIRKDDPDQKIYLRLVSDNDNITGYIKETFHNVEVTIKSSIVQEIQENEISDIMCDLPIITEENLPAMIKAGLKDTDILLSEQEIKEILNGE